MRSSRWHALGNTYLLVEAAELTPDDARRLVGDDDGIVQIVETANDEARVVIWNRDGSTAELSGNGTRIAARWLAERTGARVVTIETSARRVVARVLDDSRIETGMGPVEVAPRERVEGVDVVPVRVANPHAVVEGDPDEITRIGPLLETHPRFPQRTNVQVVRVDRDGEVTARVWERGVGETSASGTGAVAAAAATHREGHVVVRFPGGDLEVRLEGGDAWLTGPAERLEKSPNRHVPDTDA